MEKKIFVLDTNVLLHDSRAIYSFKEHDICIPLEVIEELDHFKKGVEMINYNAREFSKTIDKFSPELLFDGGAPLGKNLGKIRIIITPVYHEDVAILFSETSENKVIIDNRIINTAFTLSRETKDASVILVSKDVNMRIKARALKVEAEDYRTDKVENINFLYQKVREVKISSDKINSLNLDKEADSKIKATENEPLILKNGRCSALAIYKEGKLHLIKKERVSAFGVKPKNSEQTFALNALLDPSISLVCLIGKAGTGKTILSLAAAMHLLNQEGHYDEIMFTRQTISLNDRDQGFLPGDLNDKISPFMKGLYDNLAVIKTLDGAKTKAKVERLEKDKKIVIEPLSVIRGRSLANKIFIIDEAQNLTPKEVKAIITRAGEGTKIILLGDISQTDTNLLDERSNGLSVTAEKMKGQKFFAHIVLQKSERSYMAEVAGDLL